MPAFCAVIFEEASYVKPLLTVASLTLSCIVDDTGNVWVVSEWIETKYPKAPPAPCGPTGPVNPVKPRAPVTPVGPIGPVLPKILKELWMWE